LETFHTLSVPCFSLALMNVPGELSTHMHALKPDACLANSISCVGFLAGVNPGASPELSTFHSVITPCAVATSR
jgi:hypothetical protein